MPLGQAQHPDEKIFAEQFGHGLTDQLQTTAFALCFPRDHIMRDAAPEGMA